MAAHVHFDDNLLSNPHPRAAVHFARNFGRRFLLVVDTEEEFDWSAPFNRASQSVTAMAGMARAQRYFEAAQVRPLYVTDYPVASSLEARDMMAQWVADGTADIGAHLHPWVNPPHAEEVCDANSYAGNLPEPLERAKLTVLHERLTEAFGKPPVAYRAGRYGVGPNTGRILTDLGYKIDTSVRSRFDYSAQHGPDFTHMPRKPYRAGPGGALLELPLSTAYVGALAGMGDAIYPRAQHHRLIAGGLSRLGLLRRVPLTPEGVPIADAIAAVDALAGEGQELLLFSFHSPTLSPGNTPYVRTPADLDAFYAWWDAMLGHLARTGITSASVNDILAAALPQHD